MVGDEGKGGFSGAEIETLVNSVFEAKFVKFLDLEKQAEAKGESVSSISISVDDFCKLAENMKKTALCNQKGKKRNKNDYEKSVIEEIREINELYQFTPASEKK